MVVGRKRVLAVDKSIVEEIMKGFRNPGSNALGDDYSEWDADNVGPPPGDLGMDIFVLQHDIAENGAKIVTIWARFSFLVKTVQHDTVSCYTVLISNPAQFDYVVSRLSAGLSFRQVSKFVKESRDRLGAADTTSYVS